MNNNYIIERLKDEIFYVYSPMSCGVVYFKEELRTSVELLLKGEYPKPDLLPLKQSLLEEKILLTQNFDQHKLNSTRPLRTLYMSLTYACNLNCTYCLCHNSFGKKRKIDHMSEGVAKKAIEKFIALSDPYEEREVVLYGGEPLLLFKLIQFIYSEVRKAEERVIKEKK